MPRKAKVSNSLDQLGRCCDVMNKQLLLTVVWAMGLAIPLSVAPLPAFGQDGMDDIEGLFSQEEQRESANPQSEAADKAVEVKELSDLGKLSAFKDIAVIQKRYLPKTGRFEFFGGGAVVLNDVFFMSLALSGRVGYYFQERYGIEFVAMMFNTIERQVTTDLREQRGVSAKSFITPENYFGLDFKWTPIYGKMSWINRKITPFDLYFSGGGGMTSTNQGSSVPTIHLGTGQVFALSKSMAFRWDFSWNFFSAKSEVAGTDAESTYNNLMITLGMSFFFPEASYR